MNFVPLQVLSSFSLLKSTTKIDQLIQTAKQRGYQSLALTDEDVLYGVVDFYNAAKQAGIHPIIGLTLHVLSSDDSTQAKPVVLLAKNQDGYQNLMTLSTMQQTKDDQKMVTVAEIAPFLHQLIVILPPDGELYALIQAGATAAAGQLLEQWRTATDQQSLLIGISNQSDVILRQSVQQLGDKQHVALVALNRVGYLNAQDHFAVEVLRAIDRGDKFNHPAALASETGTHWLKPMAEVTEDYDAIQLSAAAYKTQWVSEQCQVDFTFQTPVLPHFHNQLKLSSAQYLQQLCVAGLQKRSLAPHITIADYQKRLKYELSVIHQMGFDDYFLIIWDVMRYAHEQNITTGPGRGSAAGSLVAYALAITDVDPLQYHLLFERFLNQQRAQMPDIDLDIPDNRREEILQYVHDQYGHERVAQIITFGTLAAKQVIRDVGRTFGLSQFEMSTWSSAIPNQLHITLQQAYQGSQRLQNLISDSQLNQLLFQTACVLEGLPRHYSTHAAGIVLSAQSLTKLVPLQNGSEGLLMTQFPKDTVEALGLLKMDFLGLRNLTIMAQSVALIKQQQPDFLLQKIDLADGQTLALFQRGDTNGVFQFESAGIKNVLVQLHPDSFELIVAVNALYRPGPMENIDHFIARKKGTEPILYPDESLKSILGPTFGILVYQEQVMQVASQMAGFSLGEADLLRRAMSKKKRQTMDDMRSKFLVGAKKRGYAEKVATQVFDYIDQFANYGFNRSHAVAYSKMAFEMGYLKTHFPAAFFAALLNSVMNNPDKIKLYLLEASRHQVKVLGPNINHSASEFTLVNGHILFGLASIKGLRRDFIEAIKKQRTAKGPFADLLTFIQRLDSKWRKAELIEPLIYSGAFDGLGYNRAELIDALPKLLDSIELTGESLSLFEELKPSIDERAEFSLTSKLSFEEQYLGAYLSGHPVSQYSQRLPQTRVTLIAQLAEKMTVNILLFVSHVKVIRTKRGEQMAFVSGSDQTGSIDVTVFPNLYKRVAALLENKQILLINGKTEINRGLQVIANQISTAKQAVATQQKIAKKQRWVLRIDEAHQSVAVENNLKSLLTRTNGDVPVILFYAVNDQKYMQPKDLWLPDDPAVEHQLAQLLGTNNVVLQKLS